MIRPTRILLQQFKHIKSSSNNTTHKAQAIIGDAVTDKTQLRQLMQDKTWSIKQLLKQRAIKLHHRGTQSSTDSEGGEADAAAEADADITDELILKIMGLSGIENPGLDSSRFDELRHAFKVQKTFLDHLYDENTSPASNGDSGIENKLHKDDDTTLVSETVLTRPAFSGSNGNDIQFRLVASDHLPRRPITLSELLKSVADVDSCVDAEKGEFGFDVSSIRSKVGARE
ncbi:GTF1 [Candida metapsilosis]|uniref:GTF1 n=1 Tax=Candida metapsilosis TaxID=273372 RepID=A0A8H8DBG6_9ASCO|nr:GTF1 [Candida metapsilosis]